jgi:multidrug efflux pump subunit AcrA (membrane-fusion protein)
LLKPGMYGTAELVLAKHENVLAAPEQGLLIDNRTVGQQKQGEQLRKAFVVDASNVARERQVKLGARKESRYEIIEGLAEGDRLVVRGQHGLKDGQKVEVVAAQTL